jgi:hypothetical protein
MLAIILVRKYRRREVVGRKGTVYREGLKEERGRRRMGWERRVTGDERR